MYYYKVESSHWATTLEFKSKIKMEKDQYFRIIAHDGARNYPTRFKVTEVSDHPEYAGSVVEILEVDFNVEPF